MTYAIRNARHNGAGGIDLEWNTPDRGWEWFTASPEDPEKHGRDLFTQALAGKVAPYAPPSAEELRSAMAALTRRQLKLGLLQHGITSDQVAATIQALPEGASKEIAKIEWDDATSFERLHPLIASVGRSLGLTDAQIDDLWAAALAI